MLNRAYRNDFYEKLLLEKIYGITDRFYTENIFTVGLVFLIFFIVGKFSDLAPKAYRDMFISITIPFVFGAAVYYIVFFHQIKKANALLEKMNEDEEKIS